MSYNQKLLKPGYKGRFVIQRHLATNEHWDLRLEFPVESLKDSLTSYYKKRVWDKTKEPEPKFPQKPGTVLRSWAVPKHKIPSDKPVLATETEDHDINYINFEGTIPEGSYGAGTVDIVDSGNFEILDVVYDKKYVLKFDGKKIKGVFALIKTKDKSFLWLKVKDISKYKTSTVKSIATSILEKNEDHLQPLRERRDYGVKTSSIIDFPKKTLCPLIWDTSFPPKVKSDVRNKILNDLIKKLNVNFKNYQNWLCDVSVTGSITTNLYNATTDVDINVEIDYDKFRENNQNISKQFLDNLDLRNYIRKYVYQLNDNNIIGEHPIKYFVIGKGKVLESDFIYDLKNNNWKKKPILIDMNYNPDEQLNFAREYALEFLKKLIPLILKTKINITDLYRKQNTGFDIKEIKDEVENDLLFLTNTKKQIQNLRQQRFIPGKETLLLSYAFSKNWEFFNVVFKYIEKYGFKDPLDVLKKLLTNEEKRILLQHKLIKEAIIKRCPKKDLTDSKPKSEQKWCLYTSDGDRVLGRHPTKQKALNQERAIQIHKHL